jgi:hypothetical protein
LVFWAFRHIHDIETFKRVSEQLLKSWHQKYWSCLIWARMSSQYQPLCRRCTCEALKIVSLQFSFHAIYYVKWIRPLGLLKKGHCLLFPLVQYIITNIFELGLTVWNWCDFWDCGMCWQLPTYIQWKCEVEECYCFCLIWIVKSICTKFSQVNR